MFNWKARVMQAYLKDNNLDATIFMELLFVCLTGVQSRLLKNATNYEKNA